MLFSIEAASSLHSYQQCMGVPFLQILSNTFICCTFNNNDSDRCDAMSHRDFGLHFPFPSPGQGNFRPVFLGMSSLPLSVCLLFLRTL